MCNIKCNDHEGEFSSLDSILYAGSRGSEGVNPLQYIVTLIPDLLSTSPTIAYTGHVVTVFKVDKESTSNTISFHLEDLDMTSLSPGGNIPVTEVMFDFQTTIVQLWASKSLPPGSFLTMVIGFEAKLDPALRPGTGLYKVPSEQGTLYRALQGALLRGLREILLVHPRRTFRHPQGLPMRGRSRCEGSLQGFCGKD